MLSWFKSRPSASTSKSTLPTHSNPSLNFSTTGATLQGANEGYDDVALDFGSHASSSRRSFSMPDASADAFVGSNASYPPARSNGKAIAVTNGYPSLKSTFRKLERVLSQASPALYDSLAPPARSDSPELVALLHAISPYYLPSAVLESYLCHDGQDPFAAARTGLVYGLRWLPLEEVLQEWTIWRKFEAAGGTHGMNDVFSASTAASSSANPESVRIHPYTTADDSPDVPGMSTFPPGWVRKKYSHPGWIPLLSDSAGNYIGVDLDPPPPSATGSSEATFGQSGQVIAFGREIDEKVVLFPGDSSGGWGRFLSSFVEEIARGEFARLGEGSSADKLSEDGADEEDGIGAQSYFDGDRYGEEGIDGNLGDSAASWTLRTEWRHWIAENNQRGGVIGALAERSKQQWLSVGVGTKTALQPAFEERRSLDASSSTKSDGPKSPTASSSKDTPRSKRTSRVDLTPTRNGTNSVEWTISPASPAKSIRSSVTSPRSPHFLDAHGLPSGGANARRKKRAPPPPPAQLDLPTSFDFDSSARAAANLQGLYAEQGLPNESVEQLPDEQSYPARFARVANPSNSDATPSQSTAALVSSEPESSQARLSADASSPTAPQVVVVDSNEHHDISLERLRTPSPRPFATPDNPYSIEDQGTSRPDLIKMHTGSSSSSSNADVLPAR